MRRFLEAIAGFFGWEIRWGSARMVILTKRHAMKLPRLDMRGEGFRANQRERRKWETSRAEHLCPILYALLFSTVLVMPRARPLTDPEFAELSAEYMAEAGPWVPRRLTGDFKRENFGVLNGKIVRIDYEGLAGHGCCTPRPLAA